MDVRNAVVVVTGGGSGIGAALARRFAADGAQAVVVVDLAADAARDVAEEIDGVAESVDVSDSTAVGELVTRTLDRFGRIDLFCSNAGITTGVELDDPDDLWHRAFEINTMSHVYAARAVLPGMLERGSGHLLNTASAAGLLTSPGDAPYAVSKHAAVAFAEWLAITYGDRGIGVTCLCPMGVNTNMLNEGLDAVDAETRLGAQVVAHAGAILEPEQVADQVLAAIGSGTFLVLPHAEVGRFVRNKSEDHERWLRGMRRLQGTVSA
jgi:NAD(P)-dependent dehydrogenase (short-subunit alcohol dehydrogenase family)